MAEPALDVNSLTPTQEGGGLNMDQAMQLMRGAREAAQPEVTDEVEDEQETVEDDTSEVQDLETEDDYEDLEEDESDEEEDSEGEDEGETEDDSPGFEIDGEIYTEEQLLEFKESGLRQADYTKKTQEIAEVKKELVTTLQQQQEVTQGQVQALEQYSHLIAASMEIDGMTVENLERIKDEQGWEAYAQAKEDVESRRNHLQQVFVQLQQGQQQLAQQNEALQAQRMAEATQVIAEKIPEYLDKEQGPIIREGVQDMLVEYGIPKEVLASIDVPGLFIAAHDLWKLKQETPQSVKKRLSKKKVSKKVRPVNRGGSPTTSKQRVHKAVSDTVNQAVQSGSVEDAVAALSALRSTQK